VPRLLLTAILLTAGYTNSHANPITTLFNTGVDAFGSVLPDGTIGDPHYNLITVPGGTTDIRIRTSAGGYPIPPYIGDNTLSRWIGPNNDPQLDGPIGTYVYRTTFDVTGLILSTASIAGGWSSDNNRVDILLNGISIGNGPTSFTQFSTGFVPFSIASGFVAGVNTLDFVLYNGGGPTSLRVEMSGSASPVGVPDGGSTFVLLGGVMSLLGTAWRKMTSQSN